MLRQLGPRRPTASFQSGRKKKTQRSPAYGPFAPLSGPRDDLRLARGLPSGPSTAPRISASLEGSEPPSSGQIISASLEGSESTIERANHLRLARGQRTSLEQVTHLRLEVTPRRKGQTASPLNRPSYGGIECPSLFHSAQDRRRQAAIPTVAVTGVPSITSGHCSAIPDTVAVLWNLRRGTR